MRERDNCVADLDAHVACQLFRLKGAVRRNSFQRLSLTAFDFSDARLTAFLSRSISTRRLLCSLCFPSFILDAQLKFPARSRKLVFAFNQQPLILSSAQTKEVEISLQLLAVKTNLQLSLFILLDGVAAVDEFIAPLIPDHVLARTVVAFRDMSLEFQILDRMVFRLDGEPLVIGVERRSFPHRPRLEDAAYFQTEIEVEHGSVMFLHDEAMTVSL